MCNSNLSPGGRGAEWGIRCRALGNPQAVNSEMNRVRSVSHRLRELVEQNPQNKKWFIKLIVTLIGQQVGNNQARYLFSEL